MSPTSPVTTHVLDTARGRPASGVTVVLRQLAGGTWRDVGRGTTDEDGRAASLLPPGAPLAAGTYQLWFDTGAYLARLGGPAFYPEVAVTFAVREANVHHHVPLLLSPYGYSTYRGS